MYNVETVGEVVFLSNDDLYRIYGGAVYVELTGENCLSIEAVSLQT